MVDRTDAGALIPIEVANTILQSLPTQSAALSLFRQTRLATNQQRVPVLSTLPVAYFVSGDTGLKQTTEQVWSNKYLNVEEIAAIVPVPENVVNDTSYNLWGEIMPRLVEAIGRTLDAAVFFGVNKPASWPADIVAAAVAAGNAVARGTNAQSAGGFVQDIYDAFARVEGDGFDVNGIITARATRARLRGARDTTGQPLDAAEIQGINPYYGMGGLWPAGLSAAEVIVGDMGQAIVGIREDINFKISTEGVITDNTNAIIYNLFQQDMLAMRVTFRVAFQVANPVTYDQVAEASRFPFGVVRSPAA